ARVEPPLLLRGELAGYLVHPALLDACFQSAILHPARDHGKTELLHYAYLPTGAGRVRVHGEIRFPLWCYTAVHRLGPEGFAVDLYLLDDAGEVLAELALTGTRVHMAPASAGDLGDHLYTLAWTPA